MNVVTQNHVRWAQLSKVLAHLQVQEASAAVSVVGLQEEVVSEAALVIGVVLPTVVVSVEASVVVVTEAVLVIKPMATVLVPLLMAHLLVRVALEGRAASVVAAQEGTRIEMVVVQPTIEPEAVAVIANR